MSRSLLSSWFWPVIGIRDHLQDKYFDAQWGLRSVCRVTSAYNCRSYDMLLPITKLGCIEVFWEKKRKIEKEAKLQRRSSSTSAHSVCASLALPCSLWKRVRCTYSTYGDVHTTKPYKFRYRLFRSFSLPLFLSLALSHTHSLIIHRMNLSVFYVCIAVCMMMAGR